MRLNHTMRALLAHLGLDPHEPPPLTGELQRLLEPGVRNEDGCWLLASQMALSTSGTRPQFPDRTGYEAFVNHIHVLDALGEGAEGRPEVAVGQALALGHALEVLVSVHGAFEIVVATGVESPADCNVRFYRTRPGEVWLDGDLEAYGHEGILLIKTGPAAPAASHVH